VYDQSADGVSGTRQA